MTSFVQRILCSEGRIQKRLRDILLAVSAGSISDSLTTSDSKARAVRNINDSVILSKWDEIILQLKRTDLHLFLMTETSSEFLILGATAPTVFSQTVFVGEEEVAFRGALATKTADETTANYTTSGGVAIPWDAEEYDTDSIHDTVTNNSRLTVPSGVTFVRLTGHVFIKNHSSARYARLRLKKGGSDFKGASIQSCELTSTQQQLNVTSAIVAVTDSDYFELWLEVETDTSIDIESDTSFFSMEIIE